VTRTERVAARMTFLGIEPDFGVAKWSALAIRIWLLTISTR